MLRKLLSVATLKSIKQSQLNVYTTINTSTLYLRNFSTTENRFVSKEFEEIQVKMKNLKNEPDNDIKLQIYALFKQVFIFFSFLIKKKKKNYNYLLIFLMF